MDFKGLAYLLIVFGLFVVFAGIVWYVYSGKRRQRMEQPKHRMLDDDEPTP
ncbi:cbb3-type cytochrome c oxidase subunit 3 [Geoalkalibacter halelectricus]|uniref:Cbb3-type cytochrome c oxidase subunit 3 n=1 Tax=Geoalkalibacter halelectricus TaxID=2847045 RepID=A0ABY5ZPH8_9BACT|nr:cbb3-type cytochrome c oxidase subunit 3 [Geoalkalibacter halelectricus]MDO3377500.1 cbb3-type cytochrome c oxidase subunit 3 [Geoalkalibacter halelectricus]UWZ80739.1 cbb3-type cytochrome c oxidase subunit 3 [Geoalkalibacter halelectricus]